MAEIAKINTAEQLYNLMRDYAIANGTGLSNFNAGSRIRTIFEAIAIIESTTGMDYLDALRKSIPVAMYDGFGFRKKEAAASSGYLRYFRKPVMIMNYTGIGTSCLLTISLTAVSTVVVGAPADNLNLLFAVNAKISDIVAAINANPSYTAQLIGDDTQSDQMFQYSGKEIIGSKNFLLNDGIDIILSGKGAISIPSNAVAMSSDVSVITIAAGSIADGESSSGQIAANSVNTGVNQNIIVNAIDTYNGKGTMSTYIPGVDHVVNDSAFIGGQDVETDADRITRFQSFVKGLASATEYGIISAVMNVDGIKSVSLRDNYPQRGQITVVADDGTGYLTPGKIDEILTVLNGDPLNYDLYPGYRAAGISVNVHAPDVLPVNITLSITRVGTTYDDVRMKQYAQTALENYINTRRLGQDVIFAELVKVVKAAHIGIYDLSFTTPTANVPVASTEVPRTGAGSGGTIVITVNTIPAEA